MLRLDHNRAAADRRQDRRPSADIEKLTVGQPLPTMYADCRFTTVGGRSVRTRSTTVVEPWGCSCRPSRQRGAADHRRPRPVVGRPAANAAIDHMRDWALPWASGSRWASQQGSTASPPVMFGYPRPPKAASTRSSKAWRSTPSARVHQQDPERAAGRAEGRRQAPAVILEPITDRFVIREATLFISPLIIGPPVAPWHLALFEEGDAGVVDHYSGVEARVRSLGTQAEPGRCSTSRWTARTARRSAARRSMRSCAPVLMSAANRWPRAARVHPGPSRLRGATWKRPVAGAGARLAYLMVPKPRRLPGRGPLRAFDRRHPRAPGPRPRLPGARADGRPAPCATSARSRPIHIESVSSA